jgi:hypothetical protein
MQFDPLKAKYVNVNFCKIQELYADRRYKIGNFRMNVTKLLNSFCEKKGEFDMMNLNVRGYAGKEFYIKIPQDATTKEQIHIKTVTRSRHETANKWLKIFGILRDQFLRGLEKHYMCFRAVAVITQLRIEHGHPLYQVQYAEY